MPAVQEKPRHIICHYAEIALKGANRNYFTGRLRDNIRVAIKSLEPGLAENVKLVQNRILIKLTVRGQERLDDILEVLGRVFGLAYFVPAYRVPAELEAIQVAALELIGSREFDTFRITTRKADRSFPHSSHRTNELVGAFIVERLGKKVLLKNPDLDCRIDLFYQAAFLYTERIDGPGGLPVGVSGRVALMLSGGIDSPVAGYYLLKRGASLVAIHFHSQPYTTETALEKIRDLLRVLNRYQPRIKVLLVALTPIQQEILVKAEEKYRIVLYRRFMFRIARELARREDAQALITGESLGQVASQTIENIAVIQEAIDLPVLRPLIGLDKQEIIQIALKIGTYDISIQPHLDCCTLFVPERPATQARLSDIRRNEMELDIEKLVAVAVDTAEMEIITAS
ncbi:MAG: tRNA uracil 4-sulfurtransferase ThiI [Candidatus Neomarinimicrobiota bacterium]